MSNKGGGRYGVLPWVYSFPCVGTLRPEDISSGHRFIVVTIVTNGDATTTDGAPGATSGTGTGGLGNMATATFRGALAGGWVVAGAAVPGGGG